MGLGVDPLQPGYAVVGVVLRRLERRVPHKLLYVAHVGIAVEQLRCEGVTQYVRALPALYSRRAQLPLHDPLYGRTRERRTLVR